MCTSVVVFFLNNMPRSSLSSPGPARTNANIGAWSSRASMASPLTPPIMQVIMARPSNISLRVASKNGIPFEDGVEVPEKPFTTLQSATKRKMPMHGWAAGVEERPAGTCMEAKSASPAPDQVAEWYTRGRTVPSYGGSTSPQVGGIVHLCRWTGAQNGAPQTRLERDIWPFALGRCETSGRGE